jgi:hypothetical protein
MNVSTSEFNEVKSVRIKAMIRAMSRWTPAVCALALAPYIAPAQQAQSEYSPPSAAPPPGASAPAAQRPAAPGMFLEKAFPAIPSGPWTGKRLPDGQPDVAGDWSNTIANQNNFTDPQGGIPGDPQARNRKLGPREERAPSRISDPADGQFPFQPWARAKQQELAAGLWNAVKPEYVEPYARCSPGGIPKEFTHTGYEIRQYPGYVVFIFDSGWRIIHLDGKPHLSPNIKLWNGDSRGHWEGNTLVVDVSNDNSKARFARTGEFATENVHIVERYVFSPDNTRYNYVATFTDPTAFTRPFTVTIPARRWTLKDRTKPEFAGAVFWHYNHVFPANNPGKPPIGDHFERICVENNGGFGQVAVSRNN